VGELTIPTALQFALSQRLYYEALRPGGCSGRATTRMAQWIEDLGERRHFLVHWAVWDTQVNLPVVYLMDVEDSGKKPLPNDAYRWPQVQQALMAQSVGGLKLLTIATGLRQGFRGAAPQTPAADHPGADVFGEFHPAVGADFQGAGGREGARGARTGRWSGRSRIWSATARKR
jgi:hypothetical protein